MSKRAAETGTEAESRSAEGDWQPAKSTLELQDINDAVTPLILAFVPSV